MNTLERIRAESAAIGFTACGVATLEPSRRGEALDTWLARGYGGTMRYIHRQARRRKAPGTIVPDARCAVVVLENYLPRAPMPARGPKVARYARGHDYHRVTMDRLERLAAALREEGAQVAKPYLDAGPVPERELAERAGLGWIGKNTMLIRPGSGGGSWFFIGAIFTDLDLPADRPLDLDRCGTCTRCLEACPTDAFVAPRVLDATLCISYLTIEQKGPIPEELMPRMEGWAFGCDICNEVCPWNERFAEPTTVVEFEPVAGLAAEGREPEYFDVMSEEEFTALHGDTPLARPGLGGMRRNWAAVHDGG